MDVKIYAHRGKNEKSNQKDNDLSKCLELIKTNENFCFEIDVYNVDTYRHLYYIGHDENNLFTWNFESIEYVVYPNIKNFLFHCKNFNAYEYFKRNIFLSKNANFFMNEKDDFAPIEGKNKNLTLFYWKNVKQVNDLFYFLKNETKTCMKKEIVLLYPENLLCYLKQQEKEDLIMDIYHFCYGICTDIPIYFTKHLLNYEHNI